MKDSRVNAAARTQLSLRICGHFPKNVLRGFGIEPQHPDQSNVYLLDLAPGLVATAARDHRQSLKYPPRTIEQYLKALKAQGLPQTVAILRDFLV